MLKLNLNRKAQVAPFMIIIIVVIILAIAATMLIGEVGFNRLRLANISDGTLLSSASGFCRSLNQVRAISFGASGLMVTWTGLQSYLLGAKSKCVCIGVWDEIPGYKPGQEMLRVWQYIGQPALNGHVIDTYESIYKLHDQAENIANDAPENLRQEIYNGILGGALVDEPKPFIESENSEKNEVTRDKQGRIISLDYNKYLQRYSHFQDAYIAFKSSNSRDSSWSNTDSIFYSFNKKGSEATARPGVFETGECRECDSGNYASYLKTNLNDVPSNMEINYQGLPLLYFYQKAVNQWCSKGHIIYPCCHCIILPGILYDPYAWISDINIGSNSFGTDITKRLDFRTLLFSAGQPVVEHRNKVRIKGSVWSGYDFGLEE